jgi:hypothetical protein
MSNILGVDENKIPSSKPDLPLTAAKNQTGNNIPKILTLDDIKNRALSDTDAFSTSFSGVKPASGEQINNVALWQNNVQDHTSMIGGYSDFDPVNAGLDS